MKTFSEYKNSSKSTYIKESASLQYNLFPNDKRELKQMITSEIDRNGDFVSLNHIDVSAIKDFSRLFDNSTFDGDISK